MPIIQHIDKKRQLYKNTLYNKNEVVEAHTGGFINVSGLASLPSVLSAVTPALNFVNDNKDLINSGITTVSKAIDLGKNINDTVKMSKEIEKIRALNLQRQQTVKQKQHEFTPEQEAALRSIAIANGSGFATFK